MDGSRILRLAVGGALIAGTLAACGMAKPPGPSTSPTTTTTTTTTTNTHPTIPAPSTTPPTPPSPPTTNTSPAAPALSLETEPGSWPAAVDAFIASATTTLTMTMYELEDTQAEVALAADAARGVAVRVLLNADYSGRTDNAAAFSYLSAHGVAVRWADAGAIFHQKTITIDSRESAVMTGNLTSQYYGDTRDFVVLDTQLSDVQVIDATFASDWSGAAPPGEPAGADLVWSPGATPALVSVIDGARTTLDVENEEMSSAPIEAALESAARRGVAVHVVMTADSEWDSAFNALTAAGVLVRTYRDSDDVLYIHAKAIVADAGLGDARAYVGSENFSTSSLTYNRELGIITANPSIVGGLGAVIGGDFTGANPYQG
jgi:cardiolipin synthase